MCFFFVRSMSPTTHHALFLGFLFPLNSSHLPQHSMATTMEPWMLTSRRIIYDAVLEASSSVLDRDCRPVDFFSLLVAFVVLLEYTSCKDMDTEQEVSPISTHLCILSHTPSHTRVSRSVEFATKKGRRVKTTTSMNLPCHPCPGFASCVRPSRQQSRTHRVGYPIE